MRIYQHPKAIGNARATVRAAMIPILRDVAGEDGFGVVVTPYGPEKATVPATLEVDLADGTGILAMGRLERLEAEIGERDVRLANKEGYRLYWLPYEWASAGGDYSGNPQAIGDEINPATPAQVGFVTPGSRVWIALDLNGLTDLNGAKAYEFTVVESFRNGVADVVEYEATVYRSEGVLPREVVLL